MNLQIPRHRSAAPAPFAPADAQRGDGSPAEGAAPAGAHPFSLPAAMRGRLAAALKVGPIGLIDVGSTKIACAVLDADPRRVGEDGAPAPRLLGVGLNRSRGVDFGAISDFAAAEKAIRAAVNQAEHDAGRRIFHVAAVLTGAYPRSEAASAEIPIRKSRVSENDMAGAVAACRPPMIEEGRRVLDVLPVRWTVDGESNIRSPLGFAGRRLGVDLHVLTVSESAVRNLAHCLARADLEVAALLTAPYASGLGCLTEEEREDGAAVVDLGGGATTVALFLRGAFVFADLVRLGGEHVTLDLVRAFGLGRAEAERLKTLEGCAVDVTAGAPPINMNEIAAGYGEGGRLSRADLAAAIRPRIEETLILARDRLAQAGFSYLPRRRVVLTGGGAELGGVLEVAREVFAGAVRIGRPAPAPGAPAAFSGPAFAALSGLARYVAAPPPPLVVKAEAKATASGGISSIFKWLKESW